MIFVWTLDSVIFVAVLAIAAILFVLFVALKIAQSIVSRWRNRPKVTRWMRDNNSTT